MSRVRTLLLPAAIAAGVVAVAVYVFREAPPAAWLRVDAPTAVVVAQPFVATVTLAEPRDGLFLNFDLHGRDARRHPLRVVAAGSSQAVVAQSHCYTFSLIVPGRPDLADAHAVIYVSTTGHWADRVQVAHSKSLQVVWAVPDDMDTQVAPLIIHDQQSNPKIELSSPPAVRIAISALWAAGAWVAIGGWRRRPIPRGIPALAAICLGLALWEAFALGAWIGEAARTFAQAADVYEDRRSFQQFATMGTVCALGGLAALGLRRSRPRMPAATLAGIVGYGATEFAAMLSLHEIDAVLATAFGPLSAAAALRALAAALALTGIARQTRAAALDPGIEAAR
ncbi:MAG: hypothetical protein IAE82_06770 [Opitutaceae bacterium]|nr:hypothetical protein [Opitutaceae bacterium]